MVRFVLMTIWSTLSLYAAPYWIQVSSVSADKPISPSLTKNITQNGFTYKVVEEAGRKKVRLGSFSHYNEARKQLPKIRCKIAYDAFIVPHIVSKPKPPTLSSVKSEPVPVAPAAVKTESVRKPLPPTTTALSKPCECIYDVHLLHKTELDKALRYYQRSKHYTFKTP